jgi:uncharacterized protein (TIGR02594 family)
MIISRRQMLAGAMGGIVLRPTASWAQSDTTRAVDVILRELDLAGVRGLKPPSEAEYARATRLLDGAPRQPCHPLKVARWFLTLDADDITETPVGPGFVANPVIVHFFVDATTMRSPQGDETYWCAAFTNWCLMTAGQARTQDAASKSFREWHRVNEPAAIGDLVVYRAVGDPQHGHVGFFMGFDEDGRIRTLGGNQRPQGGGRPMICIQSYPRVGSSLVFDSFQRDPRWPRLES